MVRQGHYDRLFIGGSWVEPATAERIEVISPVTEEPIASVPAGAPSDIDRAVVAARAAFEGGWAKSPLDERVGDPAASARPSGGRSARRWRR